MGFPAEDYAGEPITASLNTWSRINPATSIPASAPRRRSAACCKPRGFPLEMPASALGEICMKPSTMTYCWQ